VSFSDLFDKLNAGAGLDFEVGKPRFEKVEGTGLIFAANTNWDLFLESATSQYYLLNGQSWLTTGDLLKGKWTAAKTLSGDLFKLPDNENWKDVKQNLPGKPAKTETTVFVTTEPAELIVTEGKPQFEPIPKTKLMMVSNTDADLFLNMTQQQYYFLAAGRWFRAKELSGPWTAATTDLPKDFADIPEDSEAADVLASVPGTPQAKEAVLAATTPRKATINRIEVKVTVTYQGEPQCQPIEKTTVKYAVNTPNQVFLADNKYYCCYEGVWFESTKSTRPLGRLREGRPGHLHHSAHPSHLQRNLRLRLRIHPHHRRRRFHRRLLRPVCRQRHSPVRRGDDRRRHHRQQQR